VKSEFDFIQNIKKTYNLWAIGDDCAVLPKDDATDMVVTADMLVEDIDFQLDWTTPEFLGHKALAVSLSDIAAMGAEPKWAMLSIAVEEKLWKSDFVERFYEGWHELARQFDVELVGGDVSRAPERLVIDSIVGGEVQKGRAIRRSGAKPGDAIFVSGSLGGAAGGLALLEKRIRYSDSLPDPERELLIRQLCPTPQLELAREIQQKQVATSMIDISDGLSSDLHHLCEASGVGAKIDASHLPVDKNLKKLLDLNSALELALNGGEDFELLFAAPRESTSILENLPVKRIGEITPNVGVVEFMLDGKRQILERKGYRHF
jgi:thiamine-monophosphate kinase